MSRCGCFQAPAWPARTCASLQRMVAASTSYLLFCMATSAWWRGRGEGECVRAVRQRATDSGHVEGCVASPTPRPH